MLRIAFTALAVPLFAATCLVSPAAADSACDEGVSGADTPPAKAAYPVLTRGQVVFVNAQRLVVTQEPQPLGTVTEAPPAPKVLEDEAERPSAPGSTAIWVAGHWAYGASGLTWIAGRYVASRPGHAFVPPRWAELDGEYLYFTGFYVPYGIYVRSHFNRYYYSGRPTGSVGSPHGPYWPIGAPTASNRPRTTANARDPYWPIGARR
jgi:hypothetical protein